ncbi:hypothetical protein PV682_39150 [Streptomyces niveiscabiei]|uniref:daptide-type RiPP n=1 Tax=Streptomyces niveiscabiei TaxID=164115 RepID=UPI0029BF3095|nr:daptide-type RiPP [Streptomyces niveiscabiei]MDX3387419.1 hypothetical protein [Streptomyces niveiscabiei]
MQTVDNTTSAPLELALQELDQQLDMRELEALDAPDFSWSAALSAVGGLSAGGVISYVSIVTLAT